MLRPTRPRPECSLCGAYGTARRRWSDGRIAAELWGAYLLPLKVPENPDVAIRHFPSLPA